MTGSAHRPTRRTLVKGAAWSVPIVAVAGAAPALAASPVVTPPTSRPGDACKHPGNSCGARLRDAYHYVFCMTNNSDQDITVNFTIMSFADGRRAIPSPRAVVVPADGVEHCYTTHVINMGNSSNGQATLAWNYTYQDAEGNPVYIEGTSQTGVNDLPPCDSCDDGSAPDPAEETTEAETPEIDAEAPEAEDAIGEGAIVEDSITDPVETQQPAPAPAPAPSPDDSADQAERQDG